MPKFEYTPNISLGAILQIITLVGSCLAAYVALARADTVHEERIATNSMEIARVERKLDSTQKDIKQEMQDMNRTLQSMDEKITRYMIRSMERELNKQYGPNSISK